MNSKHVARCKWNDEPDDESETPSPPFTLVCVSSSSDSNWISRCAANNSVLQMTWSWQSKKAPTTIQAQKGGSWLASRYWVTTSFVAGDGRKSPSTSIVRQRACGRSGIEIAGCSGLCSHNKSCQMARVCNAYNELSSQTKDTRVVRPGRMEGQVSGSLCLNSCPRRT